jgi:protein-tyrosine phosphatase
MSFETSFQWVKQGIIGFGEKPGRWRDVRDDVIWLKNQGVVSILSLLEEPQKLEMYENFGLKAFHVPVNDFHAPTIEQIQACMEHIEAHRPIYVHCFAGLGRAGTIAAAWLIRNGTGCIDAIREIRRLRPGAIEVDAQFDILLEYDACLKPQINTDEH